MLKYVVILNMPGYLPEAEPIICDDLEQVYDVLQDEVSHYCDNDDEGETFELETDMKDLTFYEIQNGFTYGAFSCGYVLSVETVSDEYE